DNGRGASLDGTLELQTCVGVLRHASDKSEFAANLDTRSALEYWVLQSTCGFHAVVEISKCPEPVDDLPYHGRTSALLRVGSTRLSVCGEHGRHDHPLYLASRATAPPAVSTAS